MVDITSYHIFTRKYVLFTCVIQARTSCTYQNYITFRIAKTHISPRAKNPYHPYHTPRDPYQP